MALLRACLLRGRGRSAPSAARDAVGVIAAIVGLMSGGTSHGIAGLGAEAGLEHVACLQRHDGQVKPPDSCVARGPACRHRARREWEFGVRDEQAVERRARRVGPAGSVDLGRAQHAPEPERTRAAGSWERRAGRGLPAGTRRGSARPPSRPGQRPAARSSATVLSSTVLPLRSRLRRAYCRHRCRAGTRSHLRHR